jgi:hypothetical protein
MAPMTPVTFRLKAIQIAGEIVLREGSELALSAQRSAVGQVQIDSTLLGAAIAKALIEAFETGADRSTRNEMVRELCTVLKRLGADPDLLAVMGSCGDTLDDAKVVALLRDHNAGRPILHPRQ